MSANVIAHNSQRQKKNHLFFKGTYGYLVRILNAQNNGICLTWMKVFFVIVKVR